MRGGKDGTVMVGHGRHNLIAPLFTKLVKSLQWKRKIQCGNSCGRMLTLFEIVGAVYFCIWCGNGVPTSLFQHYTPAYNTIFLFHSVENCDISSWTTAVLQSAETFLMSQCAILRKAHTATVRYTCETFALQSSLARFSHIICWNSNLLLPYARLPNEEIQIRLDKTCIEKPLSWLHWKWLHFQPIILNWRGIKQPNTEILYRTQF